MARGRNFAPPRQLIQGGGLEALRATLRTNERYLRRWANRLGGFSTWEPAWRAETTHPVIGDGTITGSYTGVGNIIMAKFVIQPGPSTTFGAGSYYVTLPEPAQPVTDDMAIGQITLSGGANRYHYLLVLDTVGQVHASPSGAEESWTSIAPFAMANGDVYSGQVIYEGL